jgi:PAS domain S-box-containing protein
VESQETSLRDAAAADADVRAENAELRARLRALEAERRRYRDLYLLAPDAYLVTDVEGRIQEVNRAAATLLGARPADLAGTALRAFVAAEDRAAFQARLECLRADGASLAWTVRIVPAAGAPLAAALVAAPLAPGPPGPPGVPIGWTVRELPPSRGPVGAPAGAASPEETRAAGERAAVSRERVRVASELHDTLSQMLFSVALKLDWCLHRVPESSELRPKLEEIRRESGLMMAHIRALIARLADSSGGQTFSGRIRTLVAQLGELTGIAADLVEVGDVTRLGPAQQEVLANAFREALANVARHAHASSARIRLAVGEEHVEFEVADDGVGTPPGADLASLPSAPGHFGLRQMLERIEALGGRLELGRGSPSGFRLSGSLPLR